MLCVCEEEGGEISTFQCPFPKRQFRLQLIPVGPKA